MTSKHRSPYPILSMLLVVLALAAGCSEKPENPPQASSSAAPEVAARVTVPTKHSLAPNLSKTASFLSKLGPNMRRGPDF